MTNKNDININLENLDTDESIVHRFDSHTANTKQKLDAAIYVFLKIHPREWLLDYLNCYEDEELYLHFTRIEEYFPKFAEALYESDPVAAEYIGYLNEALRSIKIEDYPKPFGRYVRFSDDSTLDEIAQRLHQEEIAKDKRGAGVRKEADASVIALTYKDKDFGMLELEKVKDGVLVSIKRDDAIIMPASIKKLDFYLRDKIRDTIFKYVKNELTENEYIAFVTQLIPQINDTLKPKKVDENKQKLENIFDEETKEEALELLKDPKLLFLIKSFLGKWGKYQEDGRWKKKKPIVGEDCNKLHVTCSCVSSSCQEKINDLVLGKSSVGKTRIVSIPSLLFADRTEDLAGMSEAAPKNIEEDLDGKILVLKEIEGSANAEYYLKILFDPESDDMKVRTSEKDPETNRYTSVLRETRGKPVGITTTALPKYGIEFRNRFSLLQLDESKEQTRRIKEMDMKMKREIPKDMTKELQKFRCAFSSLRPLEVKIPFEVFYPSDEVEARRAYKRLLTLIEIVTLLHQYQRETFVGEDGNTYLKATIADFYYAYLIAESSIGMDVQGLTENARKLYDAFAMRQKETEEAEWAVSEISPIIKTDLNLNWTRDTIRGYLKELREADYMTFYEDDSKKGKPYIYSLRSVDVKDVFFCRLFAENQNQQENVFVKAIEDGEEVDGLFVFDGQKYRGTCVYDPIKEKRYFISSEDKRIQSYIHMHSYPQATNTNNTSENGEGSSDAEAACDLLKQKPYKSQQNQGEKGNVCVKCGYDGATELYDDCYFHLECLKEVKHEEEKKENAVAKVRPGISLSEDIGYEKMGGGEQ